MRDDDVAIGGTFDHHDLNTLSEEKPHGATLQDGMKMLGG